MQGTGQAGEETDARIAVRNLACRRGGRLLFAGLDFTLNAGAAAAVHGPNGVGKSSLLRVICGLLPPFAGHVEHHGRISLSDDALALDSDRPLGAALGFWARMDGDDGDRHWAAMMAMGLPMLADVPVRMLSTGQRRRASLARTLASGAAIWLLDEPANGLDTASLDLLAAAVARHRSGGGIVIAASHLPLPWQENKLLRLQSPEEEDMSAAGRVETAP